MHFITNRFYIIDIFYIKITGIQNHGKTVTVLVRGSNKLVLEEAGRSLHDALCVIRCLVKQRALIAGGGAPEIELALKLGEYAVTLGGVNAYCIKAFANALEVSVSNAFYIIVCRFCFKNILIRIT